MKTILVIITLALISANLCNQVYREFVDSLMTGDRKLSFKRFHYFYQKPYDINSLEAINRFKIFQDNLLKIENHNLKGKSKMGIGKFADLTFEEFKGNYLGIRNPDENELKDLLNNKKFVSFNEVKDNLSASLNVDWSYIYPTADNQGPCGSCFAFSTVGAIEGLIQIKTGKYIHLSKQQILDCIKGGQGCSKGGVMSIAYDYMLAEGLLTDDDYPYLAVQKACKVRGCQSGNNYKPYVLVERVYYCHNSKVIKEFHCKDRDIEIANSRGPFSAGMIVKEEFQHYIAGAVLDAEDCEGYEVNHGVIVTHVTKDTFKFRNSHGQDWGDNGYGIVSRKLRACGITDYIFQADGISILDNKN